jgi:hypothetical protein
MKTNHILRTAVSGPWAAGMLGCLVLALLLVTACKPDAKGLAGSDITGVYTLVQADGKPMPATLSHEGAELELRSGSFTVAADGSCTTRTTFVPPSGKEATREASARYTREGSQLSMKWQGAGTTTAKVEGGTLTMNNEGMVLVYKK